MRAPPRKSTLQAIIGLALFATGLLMAWKTHPESTQDATQQLIRSYEERAHG